MQADPSPRVAPTEHAPLTLVQSGGCCSGSSPICPSPGKTPANAIVVNERDGGRALFREATSAVGSAKTVGIGLDVHEQPFISVEDTTPLEAGMTFTDEPSLLWDGHFAECIEDVVVCAKGGGRVLNTLSGDMLIRGPA